MRFILLSVLMLWLGSHFAQAQKPLFPIVPNFGGIYAIESATETPDTTLSYKIVIDIKDGRTTEEELNLALNNIARMLNLHGLGGVSAEKIEVIAVIHAQATPTVLSDKDYKKQFGTKNPNTKLIEALAAHNVSFFVCGQSLLARGFSESKLLPQIQVSISALTVLTSYQRKGYALLTFF